MPDQTDTQTPARTSEQDPQSNVSRNLESPVIRVLLAIACLLMAFIVGRIFIDGVKAKDKRERAEYSEVVETRISAIEDQYGIRVDDFTFLSPGGWTIDGKQYVCTLDEPTDDPADSTLACVPAEDFVDFSDIEVEAVAP
jgi:hypothetical protein